MDFSKYYMFSDESSHNIGRYRSICLLTIDSKIVKIIHNELKELILKFNIKEFKWSKLNGDSKYTKFSNELINWILQKQNEKILRLDVIIWDTQDRRHNIKNRDDRKNFSIMYYNLLNYLVDKFKNITKFQFYPDEMHGFNWQDLENYVNSKHRYNIASLSKLAVINRIKAMPINSKDCIYIQIADFFAGLVVFSYDNYEKYMQWRKFNSGQLSLFPSIEKSDFSNSEKSRFQILNDFYYHRLKPSGISINDKKGLYTFKPSENINFWFYTPQVVEDKAPIKERIMQ